MTAAAPVSVLTVSFLVSLGLVVCTAVTLPPVWILLALLGRDPWPPPGWALALAACTVAPITAFATLCSFLCNLSCRCVGGVELTLAEDARATAAPDADEQALPPEPAEQAAPSGP
ncbi:DUF3566 domain-containing protein [Streptomyces carpinensis]|uniref:DUF3566 domain-containing protein n=1 Tax=Streptomyces carpinensis TaxID=66369 RepID=UPI000A399EA2|nr:DUF3566 domain-containing protein [Streptomyces carpinensis]